MYEDLKIKTLVLLSKYIVYYFNVLGCINIPNISIFRNVKSDITKNLIINN